MDIPQRQGGEDVLVFSRIQVYLGSDVAPGESRVRVTREEDKRIIDHGAAQAAHEAFAQQRAAALETLKSITLEGICPLRGKPYKELRQPRQSPPADTWSFDDSDLDYKSPALAAPFRREVFCAVVGEMEVLGERRAWLYNRLIGNAVDGIRICEENGWDSSHMLRWLAFDLCELPYAQLPWKSTRPGCNLAIIEREHELLCRADPSPEGRIEYVEAMRHVVLARYQRNVLGGRKGDYKFRALKFVGAGARAYLQQDAARRYARIVVDSFGPLKPGGRDPERLADQYPDFPDTAEAVAPIETKSGLAQEDSAEIEPEAFPNSSSDNFCQCATPESCPVTSQWPSRSLNSEGGYTIPLAWRMLPDTGLALTKPAYDGRSTFKIAAPAAVEIEPIQALIEEIPASKQIDIPAVAERCQYLLFYDRSTRQIIPHETQWWISRKSSQPVPVKDLTEERRHCCGIEVREIERTVKRASGATRIVHHPGARFRCRRCGKQYRAPIAPKILEPERLYCVHCRDYRRLQHHWRPEQRLLDGGDKFLCKHQWVCAECGKVLLPTRSDQTYVALRPPRSPRQIETPRPTFEQLVEGMHPEFAANLRAMYEAAVRGERPTWKIAAETAGAEGIDSSDRANYSTRLKRRYAKEWSRLDALRPRALPYYTEQGRKTNEFVLADKTPQERIAASHAFGWKQKARELRARFDEEQPDRGERHRPVEAFLGESGIQEQMIDPLDETDSKPWLNRRTKANIEDRNKFIEQTVLKFFGRKRKAAFLRSTDSVTGRELGGVGEVFSHTMPANCKDINNDVVLGWAARPQEVSAAAFPSGSKVRHPVFGPGTVQPRRDAKGRRLRAANGAELRDDRHVIVSFGPTVGPKIFDLEVAKSLLILKK